jgi:NAD+ synthase (glutamine-hydrolysing)
MTSMRIALAQINPVMGQFQENVGRIAESMERARQQGTDLVAFPELSLCGYPPEDLLLKPRFLRDNQIALEALIPRSAELAAVIGFAHRQDGKTYNAAAVLDHGRLAGIYHKIELPNYGVFDEKRYFWPGAAPLPLVWKDLAVQLTICEDVWVPGGTTENAVLAGRADIVLNISASPFHAGKLAVRQAILSGFARRTLTWVAYANLVGGQDELVFDGGSMVVDPGGKVRALGRRFGEDLLIFDLEVPAPRGAGAEGLRLEATARECRPLSRDPEPALGDDEEIYQALVLGTRDYLRKNGFRQAVIGLSGGIDSCLTAAVAVDALGAEQVVGVTMPSQYTSAETLADAGVIARNLGIRLLNLPVKPVFDAYHRQLAGELGDRPEGVAYENLQARIRGNILMALSNRFGWLVLTTGNKSEIATGYCTLYGDMAGGFAVIKDVPKTRVYQLADFVNRRAGRELIPASVIRRPPTAELRPNQKDEDSLPPYAVLDPILAAYVEEDRAPEEIAALGFDPAVVREVVRLVDRTEYKRRQAPPGIKITPKAFGRDRRLPITNAYHNGAFPEPR